MKKLTTVLLVFVILFGLALPAAAAEFSLDEYAQVEGMGCSWYQGYQPSIVGNTMTLYLPLRAASCTGPITVSIALDDPHVYLLSGEPKTVQVSDRDGLYPVKLTLPLKKDRRNGDFPATVTVTGTDGSGNVYTETIPYVLRIRDGADSHERLEPVLSLLESTLEVGSQGSLTLSVTNPTTTVSLAEGSLQISDPSGELLLPDRVSLPEVLPGQTQILTVPVAVRGDASVSLHRLELALSCQVLGRETGWSRSIPVPVTQAIRLEHGDMDQPTAIAGELSTMTLPLMNMGKGMLHNVLVKLETDGAANASSVLVGTIGPGETQQARLTFSPTSPGVWSGTVTVTCEDAYGNTFTQSLDTVLRVEAPVPEEVPRPAEEESVNPWIIVLSVLSLLLTAALITQSILLTGKLHKLEEEKL